MKNAAEEVPSNVKARPYWERSKFTNASGFAQVSGLMEQVLQTAADMFEASDRESFSKDEVVLILRAMGKELADPDEVENLQKVYALLSVTAGN